MRLQVAGDARKQPPANEAKVRAGRLATDTPLLRDSFRQCHRPTAALPLLPQSRPSNDIGLRESQGIENIDSFRNDFSDVAAIASILRQPRCCVSKIVASTGGCCLEKRRRMSLRANILEFGAGATNEQSASY
jgi:hypothetical protein